MNSNNHAKGLDDRTLYATIDRGEGVIRIRMQEEYEGPCYTDTIGGGIRVTKGRGAVVLAIEIPGRGLEVDAID